MHEYMHDCVRMYVFFCICMYTVYVGICIYPRMCAYVIVHVCIRVYVRVYAYVCIYAFLFYMHVLYICT